jgi:HlyD family secretion protein
MDVRRKWVWAGIILMATMGLGWLLSPRRTLVETAQVRQQSFVAFIEEDGRTRVRDRYVVTAPMSGRMPRTSFHVGDKISTGQPLVTLAPGASALLDPRSRRELEARVGTAEATLEEANALQARAQVQLSRTRADLDRTRQLSSRGVSSVAQLERDTFAVQTAEREMTAADRRRHAAEHALEQARAAAKAITEPDTPERFVVASPIDGRILRIMQESEGTVAVGAPLIEIGDTSDLEVIVDILTTDAALVREGARVVLDRSGAPGPLQGRVRRVEPSGFPKVSALGVEEQRVWVVVDIDSPREAWAALGDGYRVGVKVITEEVDQATVVPVGALFRKGDRWRVFVVERGRATARDITLKRRSGRVAAVEAGLKAGDVVVIYPPSTLVEGAAVRTR